MKKDLVDEMAKKFNFSRHLHLELIEEITNEIKLNDDDIYDHISELPVNIKNKV